MKMSIVLKGEHKSGGVWGQASWRRLATEIFRDSGEIAQDEEVVEFEFEVDGDWVRFRVEKSDE